MLARPGSEPFSPTIGKMLLRSVPGPESVLAEAFFEGAINNGIACNGASAEGDSGSV
jgi:hypothetical protein